MPLPFGGGHMGSLLLLLVSIVFMGVSAVKPQVFDGARVQAQNALSPVLETVSMPFQRASAVLRDVSGIASLQATNARLEQENARLREWYQNALLLEAENKSLRSLLNLKLDPEDTFVTARVIADSGNAYVKSLLVSVGEQDGVEKGHAVLSGDGLVGRIIEAAETSARVLLVTDMNSRVPVVVADTTQHAIMAGTNTQRPELVHLPQDSEIAEGAYIVTSGYGGVYPAGLPVGRVVSDEKGRKRVELLSDLGRLQYVRIIQKKEDENPHAGHFIHKSSQR